MDFGLGESLKMFEGHFGPRATKALLGIIAFAILAFCLHAIYEFLLLPIYKAILYLQSATSLQVLLERHMFIAICSGLVAAIICVGCCKVIAWLCSKRIIRTIREARQELVEIESIKQDGKNLIAKQMDSLERLSRQAHEFEEQCNRDYAKLKLLLDPMNQLVQMIIDEASGRNEED